MLRYLVSLICGLLFGAGLALSGMTRPLKVLGFLDVAGKWDPSLIFVLGAAATVATVAFHFILQRKAPLLAPAFDLPTTKGVDRRLITGALIFGVGWGIAGFCPGPAIALLAAHNARGDSAVGETLSLSCRLVLPNACGRSDRHAPGSGAGRIALKNAKLMTLACFPILSKRLSILNFYNKQDTYELAEQAAGSHCWRVVHNHTDLHWHATRSSGTQSRWNPDMDRHTGTSVDHSFDHHRRG
jgi:hypothetical protein